MGRQTTSEQEGRSAAASQDQHGQRALRRVRPLRISEGDGFQLRLPAESAEHRIGHTQINMTPQPPQTKIQLANTADYREGYANSVQVRVSLWDFFLMFGTINQTSPDSVQIHNFQGIFLSPQQAKALANVLNQNVSQYESAFGEIKLEPHAGGPLIQ